MLPVEFLGQFIELVNNNRLIFEVINKNQRGVGDNGRKKGGNDDFLDKSDLQRLFDKEISDRFSACFCGHCSSLQWRAFKRMNCTTGLVSNDTFMPMPVQRYLSNSCRYFKNTVFRDGVKKSTCPVHFLVDCLF